MIFNSNFCAIFSNIFLTRISGDDALAVIPILDLSCIIEASKGDNYLELGTRVQINLLPWKIIK